MLIFVREWIWHSCAQLKDHLIHYIFFAIFQVHANTLWFCLINYWARQFWFSVDCLIFKFIDLEGRFYFHIMGAFGLFMTFILIFCLTVSFRWLLVSVSLPILMIPKIFGEEVPQVGRFIQKLESYEFHILALF